VDLARLFDVQAFEEISSEHFKNLPSFKLACIQMLHRKLDDFILLGFEDFQKP
jgi:hypothetical protein